MPSSPATGKRLKPVAAQTASTSATVEPGATVARVAGAMTIEATDFSVKPSAPASRSYSSASMRPSPRDSSTRAATSSRVKLEWTSSLGSMRSRRSTPLAAMFMTAISGRSTVTITIMGGLRTIAARSAPARAMFLGTISPRTTCR